MKPKLSLPPEIENAVRDRKIRVAQELIDAFLKSTRHSLESRLLVCDGYRRLGLHRKGFLLIQPGTWASSPLSAATPAGLQQLWCARFLNLLGATHFAVHLLSRTQPGNAQHHRIAGNIYLSAYRYPEALDHFSRAAELETDPASYEARMGRIGLADSLAADGRMRAALRTLSRIPAGPGEALLKGILLQAEGEYLALAKDWKAAAKALDRAMDFYPAGESPDHGFLHKWSGYVQARLGNRKRATAHFRKAVAILKRPELRPETWLDAYRLMEKVKMAPSGAQLLLKTYPGLGEGFLSRLDSRSSGPLRVPARGRNPRWWISESRGEWRYDGKNHVGLPKEIQLLALLKRSGKFGIASVRLQTLLWPEEAHAFPQLEARMHLLLNRLRKVHDIEVAIQDHLVRLGSRSFDAVEVEHHSSSLPWRFFEAHSRFRSAEFQDHYGLSKAQSAVRLKQAREAGWIRIAADSAGKNSFYRVDLA